MNRVAQHPVKAFAVALAAVGILSIMDAVMKHLVLADSSLSLLGQSYLSRMGEVQMRGDYMVLR